MDGRASAVNEKRGWGGAPMSVFYIDPAKREQEFVDTAEFSMTFARGRVLNLAEQVDAEFGRSPS
eukprot:9609541-Lingulodinium_polyedra.AAC.1